MSAKRLYLAIAIALSFTAPAAAQRNELSAIVGRTFISD